MFNTIASNPVRATALVAALAAVVGCSVGAGERPASASEPLRCEIERSTMNGALVLRGVVHADKKIAGTYRLTVTGSGSGNSANISQGGGFSASGGETARLGTVMLGNRGGSYDVRLEIEADGLGYQCAERI